jgi:hypothetical protein
MRVFFSHAWDSKVRHPALPRILNQLEEHLGVEVWKDNEQLDARTSRLRVALEEAIRRADAFLLAWSSAAAQSPHVLGKLDFALAAGKPIIISCLEPDVPLPPREGLRDQLEIHFFGDAPKLAQAQHSLAKAIIGLYEHAMDDATRTEHLRLRKLVGSLEDIGYRCSAGQRGAEGRDYLLRSLNKALALAEHDDGAEARVIRVLKPLLARYQDAAGDPEALRAVLREATKLGASHDPLVVLLSQKLREEIQAGLAHATGTEAGAQTDGGNDEFASGEAAGEKAEDSLADFARLQASVRRRNWDPEPTCSAAGRLAQGVQAAARAGVSQLETLLGAALPLGQVQPAARLVWDYIQAAPGVVEWLVAGAVASQSPQLVGVATALAQYWESPNDLIPDSAGILGRLDDAWLIHSATGLCLQAGWIAPAGFPADPARLGQGGQLAAALLPPQIHSRLVLILREILEPLGGCFSGDAPGGPAGFAGEDSGTDIETLREQVSYQFGGEMLKRGI